MSASCAADGSKLDAALLFGGPLSREEFFVRVDDSDWLSKYRFPERENATNLERFQRDREQHLEMGWKDFREWVAEPFSILAHQTEDLGAEVFLRATLETLRHATSSFSVVVVISHWKGPHLGDDWISDDEHLFVERVQKWDSALSRWLLKGFEEIGLIETREPWFSGLLKSLFSTHRTWREVLGDSIKVDFPESLADRDGIDLIVEHPSIRAARRREELDTLFEGLLRPGNRLELFDGLHSKETVERAISPDFTGILDLTSCTSSFLADHISQERGFRFRVVQFPHEQEPLWMAKHLELAFGLSYLGPLHYLEARERAARELGDIVRDANRDI